jgi:hypothetical protein
MIQQRRVSRWRPEVQHHAARLHGHMDLKPIAMRQRDRVSMLKIGVHRFIHLRANTVRGNYSEMEYILGHALLPEGPPPLARSARRPLDEVVHVPRDPYRGKPAYCSANAACARSEVQRCSNSFSLTRVSKPS